MTQTTNHHFIDHLYSLATSENRGALAALRRGLGQPPGTVAEMYRYVVPHLPSLSNQETACYLIAPLFAMHTKSTNVGNLGDHMRACNPSHDANREESLERRFTALLSTHPDDMPDYLRQAVSFLKSKDIPVNWNQLFWDLQNWDDEDRRVQKKWANAFWARAQAG